MLATIGIIIDVVLVAVLVISAIVGFKKGFLKSFISLFSWVVCLAVAIFVAKYVAKWINGIYNFSSLIGNKITESLNGVHEFFKTPVNTFGTKENLVSQIPSGINGLLTKLIQLVFNNTKIDVANTSDTVSAVVGSSLGSICMVIISAILVFIVLKIAIALLSKLFDNIARTKILGGLNKVFGLVFGLIKSLCVILILNGIVVCLTMIPAVNKTVTPLVHDNTHVEKVIYNATDRFVGKYIIDGKIIQSWVNNLWNNR